ncbi:MAG: hypothetical protein M3Z27_04400 [Actinomycetota bacterium]|nr:hypothetical protein [Actinomycetota bacterium]
MTALAVIAPGTAAAASSSTCQAYNPQLCSVAHHGPSTSGSGSGTLPFTGLDVALLAVGGGGLLGTGLVVRRLSSRLD